MAPTYWRVDAPHGSCLDVDASEFERILKESNQPSVALQGTGALPIASKAQDTSNDPTLDLEQRDLDLRRREETLYRHIEQLAAEERSFRLWMAERKKELEQREQQLVARETILVRQYQWLGWEEVDQSTSPMTRRT
ncbi:MAG: hypothetical protein U0905_19235 [Pirellulales bacterium]